MTWVCGETTGMCDSHVICYPPITEVTFQDFLSPLQIPGIECLLFFLFILRGFFQFHTLPRCRPYIPEPVW